MIRKINSLFAMALSVLLVGLPRMASACDPLEVLLDQGNKFLLRSAFNTIKEVCCRVAADSWAIFAPSLQGVVAIGIAIYIAMYTLRNLGSFSHQDTAAYLTGAKGGVLPLLIKGAFIIFLLNESNAQTTYKWMITPILQAGADIGGAFKGFNSQAGSNLDMLFNFVISQAESFNSRAYRIVAMGRLLLCAVHLPESLWDWYWILLPFGATLYVFGWLIIIGVSFYFLDILFRLGVGCIMLPMALACAVSKYTSHYTKQTWNLFINVAFNFVMLSIIVEFTMKMIESSLGFLSGPAIIGAAGGLFAKLSGSEITEAVVKDLVQALSVKGFVYMSLSCLIAFKLCMDVESLTEKISSTRATGQLAQNVSGEAGKKVNNIAQTPFREFKNITGAVGKEMVDSTADRLRNTTLARKTRQLWRDTRARVKRGLRINN